MSNSMVEVMMGEYFPAGTQDRLHPETLLSTTEAAAVAKVSERTIRSWCDSGALPCFRLGVRGHRRIRAGDLYAYRLHDERVDLAAAAPPERVVPGWAHVSDGWGGWRPPASMGDMRVAQLRRDARLLADSLEQIVGVCDAWLAAYDRGSPSPGSAVGGDDEDGAGHLHAERPDGGVDGLFDEPADRWARFVPGGVDD